MLILAGRKDLNTLFLKAFLFTDCSIQLQMKEKQLFLKFMFHFKCREIIWISQTIALALSG